MLYFEMFGWICLVVLITVAHYLIYGVVFAPVFSFIVHRITLNDKLKEKTMFALCYVFFLTYFFLIVAGIVLCCTGVFQIIPYPKMPT